MTTDPDTRPVYEQVESVARYLHQGGPRKPAIQDLNRIALMLRKQPPADNTDLAQELTRRLKATL